MGAGLTSTRMHLERQSAHLSVDLKPKLVRQERISLEKPPPLNAKRMYCVMRTGGLLLERHVLPFVSSP